VSRKITRGLARVRAGLDDCVFLGNLDARRDWGHARDYVEAQWLMLQQPEARDYVIATGRQHSVRECVQLAGERLGMRIQFRGTGLDELGVDTKSGRTVVRVDARYFRPTEVETLLGDASRARDELGWTAKTSFETLIHEMADADLKEAERDALMARQGYRVANARD